MFVKLMKNDGQPIWINKNFVAAVSIEEDIKFGSDEAELCTMVFVNGEAVFVREDIEEVVEKFEFN